MSFAAFDLSAEQNRHLQLLLECAATASLSAASVYTLQEMADDEDVVVPVLTELRGLDLVDGRLSRHTRPHHARYWLTDAGYVVAREADLERRAA